MTALETLKDELLKVQQVQAECMNEEGFVLNHCKYKYQELSKVAKDLRGSIEWMQALYEGGVK
jgi:hypothetical protein